MVEAANDGRPGLIETTVTFLEMSARPGGLHVPPPAVPHVLLRVENCPLGYYRYLYDAVGRDWVWVDRKRMSDEALGAILSNPKTEIYVLHVRGAPAGFYELDFREMPERANLSYFGLMGPAIGKGFGRWLLGQAIETAWDRGPFRLTVNTCTLDHPTALPLYQRMGFSVFDRMQVMIDPKV